MKTCVHVGYRDLNPATCYMQYAIRTISCFSKNNKEVDQNLPGNSRDRRGYLGLILEKLVCLPRAGVCFTCCA